ncbi:MAG TPA: methionyl-tRNA formyltransferase [Acholeplasmataceae bacterium]|nr:methionyl-tRNA formyltransferase [Acholeplasmataceae bacterium]
MRIVFMGTPDFSVPILKNLIKHYEVILVVTQPDKPVGRKRVLTASPVKDVAIEHGIEVFQPIKIRNDFQKIIDLKPDYIVTAAYGQILPRGLIDNVHSINIHASLLPLYRGGAPIQKSIMNLDKETGISIMKMEYKMDSGDVYYQESIPIKDVDTTTSLTKKLSILGSEMILEYLNNPKKYPPVSQDESKATFAYNITFDDQIINWNQKSSVIEAHIRAMQDEPGAITYIGDHILKIYEARKSDIISNGTPGVVTNLDKKLLISTADYDLEILKLQPAGKRAMLTKDFLNGQTILKLYDKLGKEVLL